LPKYLKEIILQAETISIIKILVVDVVCGFTVIEICLTSRNKIFLFQLRDLDLIQINTCVDKSHFVRNRGISPLDCMLAAFDRLWVFSSMCIVSLLLIL